ncbi:MAG: hypothetical protein J5545_03510 [Bacteroidaceae bacterium]|nr:hypothetical protein [Bacteroidaceae bacterium]
MTNYEYILIECKNAHYHQWTPTAVEACVKKLKGLTREELVRLFTSRWLDKKDELRQVIFAILFQNEKEQLEAMIHNASVEDLGKMLIEKNGKYVKWARQELKERYQRVDHDTQMSIISFFMRGQTKTDVKWGQVREKWQKRGFANPPSIFDSWGK